MKQFYTLFLILLVSACMSGTLNAQSLNIYDIDASKYPDIKAQFKLRDANSVEIRDINIGDIDVIENSVKRVIKSISCGAQDKSMFSAILVIDKSGSMTEHINPRDPRTPTKMDMAKNAAVYCINALPANRSECAIMTFSLRFPAVELKHDFSTDKKTLIDSVYKIVPYGGTDYNAAFLSGLNGQKDGALYLAKRAKYKPIIIFLTDGVHEESQAGQFRFWDVLDSAKLINASIYCLTLGLPMPDELKLISDSTGGKWYSNQTDEETMKGVYADILADASNKGLYPPCEIVWETDCSGGGNVTFQSNRAEAKISQDANYTIDPALKPYLEVTPRILPFVNVSPPSNKDLDLTITARRNFVHVTGQNSIDPRFTVINWNGPSDFILNKDASRTIKVRYTASDSMYTQARLDILGSACDSSYVLPASAWILPRDVDMGTSIMGTPKTRDTVLAFVNMYGSAIRIDSMYIKDLNNTDFSILSPVKYNNVRHGDTLRLKFQFTPQAVGFRESHFYVATDKGTFYSRIFGNGSGEAGLTVVSSVNYPNANCSKPYIDTVITLKNSGTLALKVESIDIDDKTNFDFKPNAPRVTPFDIQPGGEESLTIRFQPVSAGLKSAKLIVASNAKNLTNLEIPLTGTQDSIYYIVSKSTIDFGVICPGEKKDINIDLGNTGSRNFTVTGSVNSPFSINSGSFDIAPATPQSVTVSLQSNTEGDYSETLTFTDDICNIKQLVTLKGKVENPAIKPVNVSFISTVGSPKTQVVRLENTTARDLEVSTASCTDPQFTIISPAAPFTIPAGGNIDVTVQYLPTKNEVTLAKLNITGSPCDFSLNADLTGNPSLALADVVIDHHEGLIGEIVEVPVNLKNLFKVAESGTNSVNITVSFDDNVLEAVPPTPAGTLNAGIRSIDMQNLPVSGNNDQAVCKLYLRAKDNGVYRTDLNIDLAKSIGGEVFFKKIPGEFIVKKVSADIILGLDAKSAEFKAFPGEIVEIPVTVKNAVNLSDFNHGFKMTLKFNASLLEPVDPTPKGTVDNGFRTVVIDSIPLVIKSSDSVIAKYKFRAMLGNAESTPIDIVNLESIQGKITANTIPGKFTLAYVCESGGNRLFDPWGKNAQILSITPNPASGSVEVDFETSESGQTFIRLTDNLGKVVMDFSGSNYKPGQHKLIFNADYLPTGVYYLTMQTPTQVFTEKISVIK